MIKIIIEVVGNCKYEYVEWPNNYERIETGDFIVDIEKAKNILSWEPKVKIEDGVKKTFVYYQKNKFHYWH